MKSFDPQQAPLPGALTFLTRLYPRAFRERFGAEMEATLAEQWQAQVHQNRLNRCAYTAAVVFDAVFNAAHQHVVAMTRPASTPVLTAAGGGEAPVSPEKTSGTSHPDAGFGLLPLTLVSLVLFGSAILVWGQVTASPSFLARANIPLFYLLFSFLVLLVGEVFRKALVRLIHWRPSTWKAGVRNVCMGIFTCLLGAALGWALLVSNLLFTQAPLISRDFQRIQDVKVRLAEDASVGGSVGCARSLGRVESMLDERVSDHSFMKGAFVKDFLWLWSSLRNRGCLDDAAYLQGWQRLERALTTVSPMEQSFARLSWLPAFRQFDETHGLVREQARSSERAICMALLPEYFLDGASVKSLAGVCSARSEVTAATVSSMADIRKSLAASLTSPPKETF